MSEQQLINHFPVQGSIYHEKRFNVQRVPTIQQVQTFFSLMQFGTKWHAFFSLCFFCGLRPIEICNLTTDDIITTNGRWTGLNYAVGKPAPPGRPKKGELPRKAIRKWNKITEERQDIPPEALESLRIYWLTERKSFGTLFLKCHTQYGKAFSELRKKMIQLGHNNWASTNKDYHSKIKTLNGTYLEHDITPYSGRRFFVSCYHWLKTSENRNGIPDLLETQRRMAHTGSKDTQIYVYPWRDLGINNENIGQGWKILEGTETKQKRLNEYVSL